MRNFMAFDRKWLEEVGSEDSHGRALWALGVLASSSSVSGIRAVSKDLFMTALPAAERLGSLRSYAFTILGLVNVLSEAYSREGIRMLENLAGRLNTQYVDHASDEWRWFEPQLTYDNARLAQALWTAGHLLGNEAMIAHGKEALVWLDQVQTDASGCFLPIGSNRFYHEGGVRDRYDQQPIEAAATVDAYNEAYRITGDLAWRQGARRAFGWFHGANTELLSLIDECTGGCKDGLKRRSVNHNQGAESTLAYIASALFISQMDIESAGDRGKTPFAKERP
jgi:hypothetical protein